MTDIEVARLNVFNGISESYISSILIDANKHQIKAGEYVFKQGDMGGCMYIVLVGKLDIVLEDETPGSERTKSVATIEAGMFFGEVCMFCKQKRTASVKALSDSTLLEIDGDAFRQAAESGVIGALQLGYNISLILGDRLQRANALIFSLFQKAEQGGKTDVVREIASYRKRFYEEADF